MSYADRRRMLWVMFLIGLALIAIVAQATTFIRLSFPDLVRYSNAIARVRCLDSQTLQERGEFWTDTRFAVLDQRKGALPSVITVRQLGGRLDHLQSHVDGTPQFQPGEEVFLFLRAAPSKQFYIVGWMQGTFRIRRDPRTGAELITQDSAGTPIYNPESHSFTEDGIKNLPLRIFDQRLRAETERAVP